MACITYPETLPTTLHRSLHRHEPEYHLLVPNHWTMGWRQQRRGQRLTSWGTWCLMFRGLRFEEYNERQSHTDLMDQINVPRLYSVACWFDWMKASLPYHDVKAWLMADVAGCCFRVAGCYPNFGWEMKIANLIFNIHITIHFRSRADYAHLPHQCHNSHGASPDFYGGPSEALTKKK